MVACQTLGPKINKLSGFASGTLGLPLIMGPSTPGEKKGIQFFS